MLSGAVTSQFIGSCNKTETKNIGRSLLLLGIEWYIYKSNKSMMQKLMTKKRAINVTIDLLCIMSMYYCLVTENMRDTKDKETIEILGYDKRRKHTKYWT